MLLTHYGQQCSYRGETFVSTALNVYQPIAWAGFLPQNDPSYGLTRLWHALAPGSRKDLGCFAIPDEPRPTVVLCESAIDAISCFALHPEYRCLSTAGARPNPRWLPPLLVLRMRIA